MIHKRLILLFFTMGLFCLACDDGGAIPGDDTKNEVVGTDSQVVTTDDTESDTTVDTNPASQDYTVTSDGYVTTGDWAGYAWVSLPQDGSVTPVDFSQVAVDAPLCISGATGASYNSEAKLAINVNQEKGVDTPKGVATPATGGLFVDVDNIGGSPLRVQLLGAAGGIWCAVVAAAGGVTIPFDSFNTACWDNSGTAYNNEELETIAILVPGDITKETPFEFCLMEMGPAELEANCEDVPVPGDEFTCAQQAGWGKCDESWMKGYCQQSCGTCDGTSVKVELDTEFDTDVDTAVENHPGYRVQGRDLYDRCGEKVVLRGVNKMTIWQDLAGDAFPEIAKTGANAVRIVWLTTGNIQTLDTIVGKAIENQLIPIIELHDATGKWELLGSLVDWWVTPEVVAVVQKYEENLLVNIGNEVGESVLTADFVAGYKDAITRMREAGYRTPLIIDAANWGQNINILQETGPTLFNHDPHSNILFSVHMWWPTEYHNASSGYETPAERVTGEIAESVEMGLPLIVGEFAHVAASCTPAIPYETIMTECQANGIGWLAWSWGPGNSDCEDMDMTKDNLFTSLWGWALNVATDHVASIANTSVRPFSMVNGSCQ